MSDQADDPFVKPVPSWDSKHEVPGWFPGLFATTLHGNISYLLPAAGGRLYRNEDQAMDAWRNAKPADLENQGWIDRMYGVGVTRKINQLQLYRTAA